MALQIFGVIRLQPKFRTLTKCHTEKRRVRRVIKTRHWQSRRRRWCVERRRQFANSISNLYKNPSSQKSYQESLCYTSVALCVIAPSVPLPLSPPPSVSLCALLYKSFSLSLHISEEPKIPQYESSCHSCHKRTAYNLLTYSTFT